MSGRGAHMPGGFNPVLGVRSGWDRADLMQLARNGIDNAMRLREWLLEVKGALLDLAPVRAEETSRKPGLMNAHWEDYKRLFTSPNR